MEPTGGGWLPAFAFLAAGIVIGALVVARLASAAAARRLEPALPLEQRDLIAERDALFTQIQELDATSSKRTKEQLARERYALELRAARVLQELDRRAVAAPKPERAPEEPAAAAAAASGPPAPASTLKGFLWGIGSAAAVGGLFFLVSQSAQPKAPAPSATESAPATDPAEEARISELQAVIAKNPDDLDSRLELARHYLIKNDMMAVFNETKYVLEKAPGNPRALTYQSLVRLAMGQADVALSMLKKSLQADPNLLESYIHLMLVYTQMGRAADAQATLQEAQKRFPERASSLKELLGRMQASAAAEGQTADSAMKENPHTGVGAPGAETPEAAAPQASPASGAPSPGPARAVAGTIELDAAARGAAGQVLFVMLREGGFGAGRPLAVKRMPPGPFPLTFEIGSADSMGGETIPDDVLIEARLDSDGDPMTHPATDPYARADHVKIGARDLRLILKPR